jgi:hypothetical protein
LAVASVTVALADLVGSATLVAVMVMVCAEEIAAGAVYKPLVVSVPTDGFMLQVTAVLFVPITAAVNCCWPLAVRVADVGLTDTATGAGPVSKNRPEITALSPLKFGHTDLYMPSQLPHQVLPVMETAHILPVQ